VLTANRCRLSGDIASGRTCPLSNSVYEGGVLAELRSRLGSPGSADAPERRLALEARESAAMNASGATANQMTGWQVSATMLLPMQPVGTADLWAQALARWRGLSRYVDTEIANLKEGLQLGFSTPKRAHD
jgi:hypothetical protein